MTVKKKLFKKLPFDSRLFGYPVVRLEPAAFDRLETLLPLLKRQNVRLAYAFADPGDLPMNQNIRARGGILVDEKVTYRRVVSRLLQPADGSSAIVSYIKANPTKELASLALQSGAYSRFARDTNFTHGEFQTLYTTWLARSLSRNIAFDVLVYPDENGNIRGFITLESKGRQGNIGLLAVDKAFRRQAVGSRLLVEALRRFNRKKAAMVSVVTQKANIGACRFYEKSGFRVIKTQYVYHFWL